MTEKEKNKYNDDFRESQTYENTQPVELSESDSSETSEEGRISDFERTKGTDISDAGAESYNTENANSCCCDSIPPDETETGFTKQFTLYAGLAVAFLFIMFIYNFIEIRSLNSDIRDLTGKLAGLNNSINKFESTTYSLEVKKSLLIIDELILSGDKPTKEAAEKAKKNMLTLAETLKQ